MLSIFVDLLKQVQARYPAIGPVWQPYETERIARLKASLDLAFGAVEGDAALVQVPGTSEVPGTLATPPGTLAQAPWPRRRRRGENPDAGA